MPLRSAVESDSFTEKLYYLVNLLGFGFSEGRRVPNHVAIRHSILGVCTTQCNALHCIALHFAYLVRCAGF
jgi:hypothetical protein